MKQWVIRLFLALVMQLSVGVIGSPLTQPSVGFADGGQVVNVASNPTLHVDILTSDGVPVYQKYITAEDDLDLYNQIIKRNFLAVQLDAGHYVYHISVAYKTIGMGHVAIHL